MSFISTLCGGGVSLRAGPRLGLVPAPGISYGPLDGQRPVGAAGLPPVPLAGLTLRPVITLFTVGRGISAAAVSDSGVMQARASASSSLFRSAFIWFTSIQTKFGLLKSVTDQF